jgi:hypothetical protein
MRAPDSDAGEWRHGRPGAHQRQVTSPDGSTSVIVQDKSAGCQDGANGWQYSADGTKVLLCGSACDEVRSDPNAKVDIEFGCETKVK